MQRIATLTLNPALDYVASAPSIAPTHKIRTGGGSLSPGGGGVNVSRVVAELGGDTLAVVALGGPTGDLVGALLDRACVDRLAVPTAGETRMCVTAIEESTGLEYRLVPPGPELSASELRAALEALAGAGAGWEVASGSLPRGVPADAYATAASSARERGRAFALDTSGAALKAALVPGAGLALAKLSLGELESLVGRALPGPHEQAGEAAALVGSGAARMVAVTLGGDGALLATGGGVLRMASPRVKVVSAVGAGDSFLAAFVLTLARGLDAEDALAAAVATGAAAAAAGGASRLRRADAEALLAGTDPGISLAA